MQIIPLTAQFFALVEPSLPNEWEVEDALLPLAEQQEYIQEAIFEQVPVIWPVSNSLCFTFLTRIEEILPLVESGFLAEWVKELLDHYEKGGLQAAQSCISRIPYFISRLQGNSGLCFEEVKGRLQPYVNGLAGRVVLLVPATNLYTNTSAIFLPKELHLCADREQCFLLYKFMVSFQWASIKLKTLAITESGDVALTAHPLVAFFATFRNNVLGSRLFYFCETIRITRYLDRELPGLMRQVKKVLPSFLPDFKNRVETSTVTDLLQNMFLYHLEHKASSATFAKVKQWINYCKENTADVTVSKKAAKAIYPLFDEQILADVLDPPLLFQGELRLDDVLAAVLERRKENEKLFIDALSTLLLQLPDTLFSSSETESEPNEPHPSIPQSADQARIVIGSQHDEETSQSSEPSYIQIDNQEIKLTDELSSLTHDIIEDLGYLPEQYVSSAAGQAGESRGAPDLYPTAQGPEGNAPVVYDEWDYRRKGYRKNWCVVVEKQIEPVKSTFITDTLNTYRGQIARLRYQFEIMQTSEHFIRRQRDGDDIDFDALVESLADTVAGYPPSDRLFIRLLRDQRDIAVLFLIDMSNSTEGWVGKSIKEALVLLSEAMEMLDDRYGIYGFSGMRRLRCEIFPIKTIEEKYDTSVQQKITGIGPREYTRMAPAIRHMNALFNDIEAKLKLLIILSDGKPEDYDDYKGQYAIEDTRQALIEAKLQGVHPFCITIDRHAQSYMAHMYGPANYIFVNDVARLPSLVPEIYKVLTT